MRRRMAIPRDIFRDLVFAITLAVCAVLAIEFIMRVWDLL